MEVLRRCPLAIAQRLVHCAIALSTAVLDRVTKTMSVAPLLMNNLDNSKQKTSNLLSPAPPPYSWSLLGKSEGPAPPPSSKISWSFDLAWSPDCSEGHQIHAVVHWQVHATGWEGGVWDQFFITSPHGQPHTAFRGFLSICGGWLLCPHVTMQCMTTFQCSRHVPEGVSVSWQVDRAL